jgi:RNA polymerase sigma-54 factor
MKPTLQVRLSTQLTLTPALQQSIRLLQLSTLELQQEVSQMLDENPFLEREEEETGEAPPNAASAAEADIPWEADGHAAGTLDEAAAAPSSLDNQTEAATEREDWENGTEADDFDGISEAPSLKASAAPDEDFEREEGAGHGPTLAEHLRAQTVGLRLQPQEALALELLIDALDDDGYLRDALEELAPVLAPALPPPEAQQAEPEWPSDASGEPPSEALPPGGAALFLLQLALRWLQSMEPPGVGARSLGECLALQLKRLPESRAQQLAVQLCEQHLELLARRDPRKLMAATGANEDTLRQAQALIVRLEPKPGRPFAHTEATPVVPDVIVRRSGRRWRVQLNPDVLPRLRINDLYAQALRGQRNEHQASLSGRLQEARWFLKNVMQRFDTIERVAQVIVERQSGFFSHGALAMKPMVLREIADELGLHESTISRVTTAKYMATPQGTFELKYFFASGLSTDTGGNASSTAVKALIQQWVAAENPRKPLSDNELAQRLEGQGIQVARRTVAKYREALRIAPANLRKAL